MEVSTDWCITIEHWGLSSIRVIIRLVNYSITTSLIYKEII